MKEVMMTRVFKRATIGILAAVAALVASVTVATPAIANPYSVCSNGGWEKRFLWVSGGNAIGQACYWDTGNWLNVDDQEVDNHSMVLQLWNPQNGREFTYWDHSGAPGVGAGFHVAEFADNVVLQGRLCKGEWSKDNPKLLEWSCRAWEQVRL